MPGETLPSEKDLSTQLGESRRSVHQARLRLADEGILRVEPGRGTVVQDIRDGATLLLLQHLAPGPVDTDALELRRLVLAVSTGRAATHATFEDLADLEEIIHRQSVDDIDDNGFRAGDLAFWSRVVRASGSLPLGMVFHGLADWLVARPELHQRLVANRQRALGGYTAVLNLVRGGDGALARKAVEGALDSADAAALA